MAVDDAAPSDTTGVPSLSDGHDKVRRSGAPRSLVGGPAPRRKNNRTVAYVVIGVIVVAVVVGGFLIGTGGSGGSAPKAKPAPASFVAFHDDTTGVSISYPASWTPLPAPDPTVRLLLSAGPPGLDSAQVRVQATAAVVGSSSTSIADLRAVTDGIVSGSPVIVLPQYPRSVTINGLPGYYYLYTLTDAPSGQQLVHAHYFLFQGHSMISIVFQTVSADFTRLAATFDQMTASLRVGSPRTTGTTTR